MPLSNTYDGSSLDGMRVVAFATVVSLVVGILSVGSEARAANGSTTGTEPAQTEVFAGFDLFPLLGTSTALPEARRTVSLNLIGGVSGGIDAFELGSTFNLTLGPVRGAQLTMGANASGDLAGLQLAGAANVADEVRGAQLTVGANVANGDVQGLQLSTVNVAGRVDGLQLGVVNVARTSTASVGLISILTNGFTELEVFGSDEGLAMAGIRHGGDHVYNLYYAGARLIGERPQFAFGLGLGWRHRFSPTFEFSSDVTATGLADRTAFSGATALFKLRSLASWRPTSKVALFAGPTLTTLLTRTDSPLLDRTFWEFTDSGDETRIGTWIGGTLGARFF